MKTFTSAAQFISFFYSTSSTFSSLSLALAPFPYFFSALRPSTLPAHSFISLFLFLTSFVWFRITRSLPHLSLSLWWPHLAQAPRKCGSRIEILYGRVWRALKFLMSLYSASTFVLIFTYGAINFAYFSRSSFPVRWIVNISLSDFSLATWKEWSVTLWVFRLNNIWIGSLSYFFARKRYFGVWFYRDWEGLFVVFRIFRSLFSFGKSMTNFLMKWSFVCFLYDQKPAGVSAASLIFKSLLI